MRFKTYFTLALTMTLAAAIPQTGAAQKKLFTLEDLNFGGTNYRNMTPQNRSIVWWGEEAVRTDADFCALINKTTGRETRLFTLADINQWIGAKDDNHRVKSLRYATFPYAKQSLVLVENLTERMLVDWKTHRVVWRQASALQEHTDFAPASRATAYVRDHNLFVIDGEGRVRQISTDGSREMVYGVTAYREMFGIYKGTFWNPDGSRLAFYRMDQTMVPDYPLVDVDPDSMAVLAPEKYPMAGRTTHEVTIGVYDVKADKTIYLKVGNPKDRYFVNIGWSPDGKTIYHKEFNRKQNEMSLDAYDAETGDKRATLYTERHEKYITSYTSVAFLPWDADKFILQSQKDGYNHLYLFNTKGEMLRQLTSGNFVVYDLLGFDKARKRAIILSAESSPIQSNLYAVDIATGKRTLLDNGRGVHANIISPSGFHDRALSPDGGWIIDNYAEPTVPRNIDFINLKTDKGTRYFTADNPWKDYAEPQISSGTIKAADGRTDLYYRLVKPADFDASKKYPTVVYVYGGPMTRNVDAYWHYRLRGWEAYMAQKGFIVFVLDNRGSSDRGRDFEQATYRHLGTEEMKDQMKGVDFLKTLPYVDANRLGIHGWSFGGFMTINLMTTYPDVFKVGVAGGPVIDWNWYEVQYGELYMGTPQDNPEGYAAGSLLPKAKNLKGKLQIIIGMNDPVVLPQNALRFLKECISAGTQPDFFVYPGEPHNMRGHQSVHLHERITQYFIDYLK